MGRRDGAAAYMDTILPHELPAALQRAGRGIKLLSLDCFDTLIWRNVHKPADLFCAFGSDGPTRQQRMWAESQARSLTSLKRDGGSETGIEQIYDALLPNANASERADALARELRLEAQHSYAFAPTVQLMRKAKISGLQIAIVSDTYLSENQLRELIAATGGDDLSTLIDHVFCSSDFGVGKGEGLFKQVLRDTKLQPEEILHIGDNRCADVDGAAASQIQALHLRQFDTETEQRLRLESVANAFVNADAGWTPATSQPHRAAVAQGVPQIKEPAETLGYTTLGPVLHGFARWLSDEASAAASGGGRIHLLFLLRDGHLPQQVFETIPGLAEHSAVAGEISRFTATAASFDSKQSVQRFLETELPGGRLDNIAKQLLLTKKETAALLRKLPQQEGARKRAFFAAVNTSATIAKILKRSAAFSERLCTHVAQAVAPSPGDTLMLVDLGYHGTVQDRVAETLERKFNVSVTGRYLLLREHTISGGDKRGFLGPDDLSPDTLEALAGNVAVVEQLCTLPQGSVIDYEEDGTPLRSSSNVKSRQSLVRETVQVGCVRFAAGRDAAFHRPPACDDAASRRRSAAAALARFMFLPLPSELEVLANFQHDVNLNTDDMIELFSPETSAASLRQGGMFYLKSAKRMYLPAELRGQGLPLSLALFSQRRFGLDLNHADFWDRTVDLPIIIADGTQVTTDEVKAFPTHDGYYTAAIPVGASRFAIGVQFGKLYEWVQVDSVQFRRASTFLQEKAAQDIPFDGVPTLEGLEQVAPHLMRCENDVAFMMVPPPVLKRPEPLVMCVTFRPIAARMAASLEEAGAAGEGRMATVH